MISVLRKLSSSTLLKKDVRIQDINAPLFLIASLVGLLPHSVKFSKTKQNFQIIPNSIYLNTLCCIVVVILLFTFGAFHVRHMLFSGEKSQFNEEATTQLNYIMEVVIFIMLCCIAYVCGFLNRSKYIKILNMILTSWNIVPPTRKSRIILEKLRLYRNLIFLGLLVTIISQIAVNLTRKDGIWKKTLVGFTFNMPQIIQLVLHAFYAMLVLTVAAILENVNSHCLLLSDIEYAVHPFIDVKPRVKTMTLRQMELVYMKVFEIKTDINLAFQGPMLASILQSFHAVVSEAHILYHGLLVENITTHEIINCTTWITFQLIKIYSLAYSGSSLKLEALRTGQLLHCIPTERQIDIRWFMEVQHFSTLLKYQSVEINIYGYFPLDATLVFNMFASATMYLIILVQFDNSE